jgi:predicted lipoprotein
MNLRQTSVLAMLAVALVACGSPPPPAEPARPVKQETVFDPLTNTLDRAKGVQQTVDEQAAEQRRRLEAAEK